MRISRTVLTVCGLLISGTVAGVAAQGSPATVRACVGPAGAMRVLLTDGGCKVNETLVVWSTSGPAVPQDPGVPAPAGLRVVNGLGQDIGPLLDASTVVLTLPSGRKTYAELFPGGPPAGWLVTQYYQSTDCSGEAFVFWNVLEELVPPTLVRQGGVWATRPGTIAPRLMKSYRQYGDSGPLPTCVPYSGTLVTTAFDFYQPASIGVVYPLSVQ